MTKPWEAVEKAGGTPGAGIDRGRKVQAFNHLTPADTFEADKAADTVSAADYDGLVLPGGVANPPDLLRTNSSAVTSSRASSMRASQSA